MAAPLPRTLTLVPVIAVPLLVWALLRHGPLVAAAGVAAALGCLAFTRTRGAVLLIVATAPFSVVLRHGPTAVLAELGLIAFAAALRGLEGKLPLGARHLAVIPLICTVLVGYAAPVIALVPRNSRSADLAGLLAGLALLAVTSAAAPSAARLTEAICAAGALSCVYVLLFGSHPEGRLAGLGLNPNYLGMLGAVPLAAACGLAIARRSPRWLLAAAPCLAVVVATRSRGAFLAAAAGVAAVLLPGRPVRTKVLISAAALAAALLPGAFGAVADAGALDRDAAELDRNNTVRGQAARLALHVTLAHPLRGIGYDMFAPYAAASPHLGVYMNTHDDYLRLAAEAGLPCLASLLFVLLWALRARGDGSVTALRAVVCSYAVGLLLANTLSNLAVSAPFWAAAGLLISKGTPHVDDIDAPAGRRALRVRRELALVHAPGG